MPKVMNEEGRAPKGFIPKIKGDMQAANESYNHDCKSYSR
jgi:hypothetical protein